MPNTHCGKHTKLSKTMGVTIGMEEIISSQCPLTKWENRRKIDYHKSVYCDSDEICGFHLCINAFFFQLLLRNKPRHEKTNILVSDLVRHKPGCTATENG